MAAATKEGDSFRKMTNVFFEKHNQQKWEVIKQAGSEADSETEGEDGPQEKGQRGPQEKGRKGPQEKKDEAARDKELKWAANRLARVNHMKPVIDSLQPEDLLTDEERKTGEVHKSAFAKTMRKRMTLGLEDELDTIAVEIASRDVAPVLQLEEVRSDARGPIDVAEKTINGVTATDEDIANLIEIQSVCMASKQVLFTARGKQQVLRTDLKRLALQHTGALQEMGMKLQRITGHDNRKNKKKEWSMLTVMLCLFLILCLFSGEMQQKGTALIILFWPTLRKGEGPGVGRRRCTTSWML